MNSRPYEYGADPIPQCLESIEKHIWLRSGFTLQVDDDGINHPLGVICHNGLQNSTKNLNHLNDIQADFEASCFHTLLFFTSHNVVVCAESSCIVKTSLWRETLLVVISSKRHFPMIYWVAADSLLNF